MRSATAAAAASAFHLVSVSRLAAALCLSSLVLELVLLLLFRSFLLLLLLLLLCLPLLVAPGLLLSLLVLLLLLLALACCLVQVRLSLVYNLQLSCCTHHTPAFAPTHQGVPVEEGVGCAMPAVGVGHVLCTQGGRWTWSKLCCLAVSTTICGCNAPTMHLLLKAVLLHSHQCTCRC
jgi:hypothetical protein